MPKVFDVGRCSARRWPQKIWRKVIRGDLKQWKVNKELAEDKIPQMLFIKISLAHASMENKF